MNKLVLFFVVALSACASQEPKGEVETGAPVTAALPAESLSKAGSSSEAGAGPENVEIAASLDVQTTADESANGAAPDRGTDTRSVWKIELFSPTSDRELDLERGFYDQLAQVWLTGDVERAFSLLTRALDDRPARRELHLLRAAVVLDGFGGVLQPLSVLDGESGSIIEPAPEILLFVLDEYQRAFPDRPAFAVPWTGLYHPYVFHHLISRHVSLWSHGLRPLLRFASLEDGNIDLFDDFRDEDPSLIELLLHAQLLAVRGEVEAGRASLTFPLEKHVATEYIERWRQVISMLGKLLETLSTASPEDASRLLVAWKSAMVEAIPETRNVLVTLPPAALSAATHARSSGTSAPPIEIPPAAIVLTLIRARQAERGSGTILEPALRAELVEEFILSALRVRDFRADSLVRFQKLARSQAPNVDSVFSDCQIDPDRLRFASGEGVCVEFFPTLDSGPVPPEEGWLIPASGGGWLRLELRCRNDS